MPHRKVQALSCLRCLFGLDVNKAREQAAASAVPDGMPRQRRRRKALRAAAFDQFQYRIRGPGKPRGALARLRGSVNRTCG